MAGPWEQYQSKPWEQYQTTKPPEETTSGFTGAFGAGIASLKGETALTLGKLGLMKPEEAEAYRAKQEEEARKFKPTEKGWTEAPFEKFKELAGGSAAYMAVPLAAAGATALAPEALAAVGATGLAEAVGGAGITALGARIGLPAIASFGTNTAQFTGSNLARQMDADEGKKLADTSLLKAGATAIPQSLLDTGAMHMIPGVRKIFGQAGINLSEQAAEQVAKKGLLSTAGEYGKVIGKTAGVEGVTETGQAFLERLQAGLNLTDPEARKEYYDNFIGGAVLGGAMGGAGHFYEKTFPGKPKSGEPQFEAPPPPTGSKAVEPLKLGYNPAVEDVVEKDPLQNPVGNFMPHELTPEIVKFVNDRRKEQGKPKLRSFSIEDLVEAGAPPQEVDRLLAYKNQFDGSVNLASEDVKNIAQQKNVDTETKGFTDFLRRSTGQEDLTQMSQPQLHSAFVALNALDAAPELRVLPEGTNAVRFTDAQYDKGLRGLGIALGESPAIGRANVIQEIKDFTGLENDHDANMLLRTAIRNGDLESTRIPQYEVGKETEDGNFKVHYVSNSKEAAKRSADKLGLTVRDGFREEIGFPGEGTQLPGGPDIRMGMFKQGDKPEGYEIKAGSKVLSVSDNESEANEKAARLSAVREKEANTVQKKIEELGKKILASQNELERMEATGQGHSLEFAQLSASMHADNQAIVDETNKLKKDLNNYQQPVTVSPTKSVKPIVSEGFTFFDNGEAVASFPTKQQAEEFALSRLDDETLTNIVNVGPTLKGLMPKRLAKMAEAELTSRGRTEPGVEVKFTGTEEEARERLAKLGIFSGAVQDKVKELEKVLLPALRKLGLERVGLNIVRDIENNAEGNYAAGVIKIALDNEPGSHLGVLRHESLHALKELGAFTDKEWAVLNKQAKEKWVPQYMKGRTTEYGGKQVSLYDAYQDIYQKKNKNLDGFDEYIQEEAIAEAFRYFKPQAGAFGNIGYRLAQFFAALKNAFNGLGFKTADSVFEKIEAGKMRPKQEAAIKEAAKFSLKTISSLNTAFNIAKGHNFEKNKELKEVLQALVNFKAEKEGIDLKTYSDETKEHLVEVGLADAIRSLKSNASAVGWYDRKVNQALAIVSLVHPKIATDPNEKFAFTWALAVTSNGQKVDQNFELAEKAYSYYKRYGRMPTNIKAGQAQKAINQSLKLFNEMEKAYGLDLLRSFMATEFTASQIEKATGIKVTGEFKDTKVLGAAILGPKIGNGFFSNLNGIFDRLTMDRWLMRTWGRWTGTLVEINQPMIEKKRQELKDDVAKLLRDKSATDEISKLLKQELAPIESDEQADALAIAIQKTSMLPENRKVLNKTDAGEAIRKSGNALFKYLDGQKEAPNGPAERDAIRDVFKEILKGLHSQGYQDMTMSDLQALLWYPEKRLYDIAKDSNIEEDYTTEEAPDYANAAAKLARSKKVSNAKIQAEIKKVDEDYDNRAAAAKRGTGDSTGQLGSQGRVAPLNRKEYKRFLTRGILQSYRERNEKASGPYVRDSGKDGKGIRVLDVVAKAKYNPKTAFKNVMQEAGASVPALYELQSQDADIFQDAIQTAKNKNDYGAAVTVYPESEYAKMRLFIAEDGKAGFALKGDDIVSVFAEAPHVGASAPMLQLAVQEGGRKLDAFDTVLPDLYFNAGFKIVSRTEFNEEYQPDGWSKQTFKQFNNGKPDVVFMVFDPNNTEVPSPTAGRLYEDYDKAVEAQTAATKDYKFPVKPTTEEKVYKTKKAEEGKYSLRAQQKDVTKSRIGDESKVRFERTKELQEAVQKLARGEISRDKYNRLVDKLRPVMPYEEVPEPATREEAVAALTIPKKPMFGIANKILKAKQYVQLRLDIPAYENHNTWIVSIHAPKSTDLDTKAAFKAGAPVAYDSVARITNAHFGMDEDTAFDIARGFRVSKGEQKGMNKATIATILGQWKPTTAAEAKSLSDDALHSKDWIQVGMDPFRHGYFYNRDTMEPIWSADEVIQIGPLVLAKNAKVYTQEQEAGIKYSLRANPAQTKTPEFKRWFKDSKVVDDNGEPLVVYHGSPVRDFNVFDLNKVNENDPDGPYNGFWFSTSYSDAEGSGKFPYGRPNAENPQTRAFYLSLKNPATRLEARRVAKEIERRLENMSEEEYAAADKSKSLQEQTRLELQARGYDGVIHEPYVTPSRDEFEKNGRVKLGKKAAELVKDSEGYVSLYEDGEFVTDWETYDEALDAVRHGVFVAFQPSQIKSATENVGTFDPNNPDIRYSLRATETPKFKQWFGKSKIVDEDGKPKVMYHGTARDITAFRPKQANAIFVTDNPDFASVFSGMSEGYMLKEFVNKMTNEDKKDFLLKVLKENKKQFDKEDYNFILESINTSQNLYTSTNLLSEVGYIDKKFYIDVRKEIGRNLESSQNIMPLYVKAENPFDYENPEHVKKLIEKIKTKDKAFVRNRTQDLEDGDWATIEHPIAQKAIKDLGHDGFYVFEANEKNLAVYEPSQIKSATGNIGTFDINNPDIRYSVRANLPPVTNARIDATTGQRKTEGFMDRILSILNPETRAKLRAGLIFQFEALERGTKARAAKYGNQEYMADVSATAAALESMRAKQIVAAAMRDGVPVYRNGFTTTDNLNGTQKGLLDIFSPLAATGDPDVWRCFQFYAGSKRGARLDAEGREHTFEKTDVQLANSMAAQFKQDGIDFDAVYKEYQKWNDALVKYMKDTGVLTAADAAYFTKFGDYIPFYRQVEGEETVGPKIFSSIAGVQKPKALKGAGTYAVYDANGNKVGSYKNQNDATNRAAQIKGTVKVEGIPLGDFLENVIRNASAAVESGMKNVAANRGIRDALDLGTARQVNVQNQDTVSVKENGVTKFYELDDPLLFEAFKGLNVPRMPWVQILAKPADILRNFVTKDPGFILANIMRDSVSAWVTSGSDMVPVIDSFKQFGKILAGKSPEAVAMAKAGLGGYEFKGSLKDSADSFEKALRAKTGTRTKTEKALLPVTALWDMLEQGSNASDMATRAEIYKRVLAETGNEAEALFQASEVMNFSRKGNFAVMQAITALVPFMNARIQGMDVLYRSGFGQAANANKEKMQKAFIVRSLSILALSAMYWAMVHDDDEYKKLTKEERDGYWIIPGLTFNGKPFRFPIPFEIGVVFKVLPERILELKYGQDTPKDFRESITRNIVDTLKFNPIPQAFIPIAENITNHSFFTGEKIVGRGLEDVAKPLQYNASTSLFARELGEATGMSPIQIENFVRGYTGTMGMYAVNMLDSFFGSQGDPVKATTRAEQLPVIKRFFASDSGTVAQYYDLKDEVDEVVRTVNFLSERDPERLEKYLTESNMNLYAMRGYISTLDKHMKQIRAYRTAVNNDKTMGGNEKRAILDELHQYEIDLTADIKAIRKEFH